MTRYRVRIELIEVVEDIGRTDENVIDASDGKLYKSLTETQELFYAAMGAATK